jgi:hypothetical protein
MGRRRHDRLQLLSLPPGYYRLDRMLGSAIRRGTDEILPTDASIE